MAEYIERRKAAEVLCNVICGSDRGLCISTPENCQQKKMLALYELAAADVAPVRHGRWIEDERTYPGPGLANNLCSVCGEIAGAWKEGLAPERKWAYCPACGALMDGKEDEHEAG